MINATPKQLRKAANIQEKIQSLQSELNSILGGSDETAAIKTPRKKFSAYTRAKMRRAQQARWARIKGTAPKKKLSAQGIANIRAGVLKRMAAQGKAVQKPKRKISAAGRAAISAAAKARWTKVKAAGQTRL
jgi:hypothetical protein